MLPVPDPRWLIAYNINTYDTYLEKVSNKLYVNKEVNEDVKGIFRLVQRLIDLAYYEFEFFDVATLKAIFAFELALKKRWKELNLPNPTNTKSFKAYINWFLDNGYFETDNLHYLDQIRNIRNHFAHPEFHSFGGPMTSWLAGAAAGLVNDLYEDVQLRQARMQEKKQLNEFLQTILKPGALLSNKDGKQIQVYLFTVGLINNKNIDKNYHFLYKPLFEIPEHYSKEDAIDIHPVFEISCHAIMIQENQLTGTDKNGQEVFRLSAPARESANEMSAWHREYAAYLQILPHFPLADNRNVNDEISRLFTDFQKS